MSQPRIYPLAQGALVLLALTYLATLWLGHAIHPKVVSPLCSLAATVTLSWVVARATVFRLSWIFFLVVAATWLTTDLLWLWIAEVQGRDPLMVDGLTYAYLLPNLMLAGATLAYFIQRVHAWDRGQMLLNLSAVLVVGLGTCWMLFFQHDLQLLAQRDAGRILAFITLLLDGLTLGCLVLMLLATRVPKLSLPYRLLILGILLYIASDLVYIARLFAGTYRPYTLLDGAYTTALMFFAFAGVKEISNPLAGSGIVTQAIPSPSRTSRRIHLLLLAPLLVFAVHGVKAWEALYLVGAIGVYYIASVQLQAYAHRTQLQQEQQLSSALEARVEARTQELQEAIRHLEVIARTDAVTGLANRRHFMEAMETLLAREYQAALFCINLERFKNLNDVHGHQIGDIVLAVIGGRLAQIEGADSLLARIGGDEFVYVLPMHTTEADLTRHAIHLMEACTAPIGLGGKTLQVGAFIGMACFPLDGQDAETLLRHADLALRHARKEGHPGWMRFTHDLRLASQARLDIELLLQNTPETNGFQLYYQPQFRIHDRALIGMEALIRWPHPERGFISPALFIPIAEASQAMLPLGEWVMATAVHQIAEWNPRYGCNLRMGINLSARQLELPGLPDQVHFLMAGHGARPEWIDLEITETHAMNDGALMVERIHHLADLGVSISIDDFGTGYSSLAYLKRFRIHRLKVAKELVDGIVESPTDAGLARAVIDMARCLGLETIAEGVESEAQFEKLQALGCEEIQGYLLGKPVPAAVFEETWLRPLMQVQG